MSWAKKHILGFSDEEIKLDLQQQRIERAVASELTKTPEVITHTGLFDNLDKLYGKKEGEPAGESVPAGETGGGVPTPEASGGPAAPESPAPELGTVPESDEEKREQMNILLENSSIGGNDEYIDLSKGKSFLNEMEEELGKLLDK